MFGGLVLPCVGGLESARLQATLPPNLVASVQEKPPELLKHARATSLSAPDFAALRSTIAGELARVQGSSEELLQRVQGSSQELLQRVQGQSGELLQCVQAGELLQRGEGLFKQVQGSGEVFLREAGEFLRGGRARCPARAGRRLRRSGLGQYGRVDDPDVLARSDADGGRRQ
ncbi:hypothetical protein EVJ58_g1562 [Rhodofomes roseus]|uniref:Uncharacterized protein n=1 Tax=Rhodofomes roseus TaxID=34475 RepID=A0A4Y9Z0V1_9APHY|nr:hypothetical protein EVJ58_g1562 [Rhodofomes roseus]